VATVGVQIASGHVPVASLVYLGAVQAALRGEPKPPPGLVPAQRREVAAWLEVLDRAELRERLGIAADATVGERPTAIAFAGAILEPDVAPPKVAFRWLTNRGGVGFVAGTVLGLGISLVASRGMMPWLAVGGAGVGHVIGRRIRAPRCSACATVLAAGASACPACGAVLRGDIAHLADRLEAEERLQEPDDGAAS
jgi:hypothetical protein